MPFSIAATCSLFFEASPLFPNPSVVSSNRCPTAVSCGSPGWSGGVKWTHVRTTLSSICFCGADLALRKVSHRPALNLPAVDGNG